MVQRHNRHLTKEELEARRRLKDKTKLPPKGQRKRGQRGPDKGPRKFKKLRKQAASISSSQVALMSATQKRQMAYEMRLEFKTEAEIAEFLGVSTSTVSLYLQEVLTERYDSMAAMAPKIRAMELERCDRQILHWYRESQTNIRASELVLHWTERKHKIQGIEVSKTELTGAGGGPLQISASALDLSKLNDEELGWLEVIVSKAGPQLSQDKDMRPALEHDPDGE